MNLNDEHRIRLLIRTQRDRLEAACGGHSHYCSITMRYGSMKMEWDASIGSTFSDNISMKGEVLVELVDLLIDTYTRRNNIKLRELPAPTPVSTDILVDTSPNSGEDV